MTKAVRVPFILSCLYTTVVGIVLSFAILMVSPTAKANLGRRDIPKTAVSTLAVTPSQVPRVARRTKIVPMTVTAYCPCARCCGKYADGVTASGASINTNGSHFVAADTDIFPFGTRLSIPGYYSGAPVSVLDRGKKIKDLRLDVFFPTHEQAMKWGVRKLNVEVYPDIVIPPKR